MATDRRGARKRVRFTLDINFESEVAKEAFTEKLTAVRNLLTPRGARKLDNRDLLLALFDCATAPGRQYAEPVSTSETADENLSAPSTGSFLRSSGWFARILKYNVNAWLHVRVFTVDYMYMNHCSAALC